MQRTCEGGKAPTLSLQQSTYGLESICLTMCGMLLNAFVCSSTPAVPVFRLHGTPIGVSQWIGHVCHMEQSWCVSSMWLPCLSQHSTSEKITSCLTGSSIGLPTTGVDKGTYFCSTSMHPNWGWQRFIFVNLFVSWVTDWKLHSIHRLMKCCMLLVIRQLCSFRWWHLSWCLPARQPLAANVFTKLPYESCCFSKVLCLVQGHVRPKIQPVSELLTVGRDLAGCQLGSALGLIKVIFLHGIGSDPGVDKGSCYCSALGYPSWQRDILLKPWITY